MGSKVVRPTLKGLNSRTQEQRATAERVSRMNFKYMELQLGYRFWFGDVSESEKAMAPHSNTLAWKIPWTEELGRLQSMGSLRVRHD